MIDIHAHILPGMDDGAEDIEDTLEMARMAVENGITTMVATPHCNIPGVYDNYYDEKYIETFQAVEKALEDCDIPLTLIRGMEVYLTPEVPKLLAENKFQTINGTDYLLVESAFDADEEYIEDILDQIISLGVRPVIAHAERYEYIQRNMTLIEKWRKKGVIFQINKASLVGKFGRRAFNTSHLMMRRFQVDVIASDCHRPYMRTPIMMDVYEDLTRKYPREYLEVVFNENPDRLCRGEETISFVDEYGF